MTAVWSTLSSMVNKVVGQGTEPYAKTTSGVQGNMPGGGAMKKMSAYAAKWETGQLHYDEKNCSFNQKWEPAPSKKSMKKPVDPKYTKISSAEKGTVDSKKVSMLMAKPNRPKPLKRKKTDKLSKEEKKALITKRKEAKAKYAERSELVKKEVVYKKKALKRQSKKTKTLKKKQPKTKPTYPHILEMIYSVGPDPKYTTISEKFREYRAFAKTQLKLQKKKPAKITYLYKV